jgi:DNA polymerase III subunit delta
MGSVHLVKGGDESLVAGALQQLVHELVGAGDRTLMVEDLDGHEYEVRQIVDAAQTSPFLTEKRVVVARGIGRFAADDLVPLATYLDNPLPSTDLVLTMVGGRLSKAVTDALKRAGCTEHASDVSSNKKERGFWFDEQFAAAGLKLDGAARNRISEHIGEDAARLAGLLETLASTYGDAPISANDVGPFLGDAGSVAPWDLTDAIDRGDAAKALAMTHRMMRAGERHPLVIMSTLHGHYQRMLKLEGSGVGGEAAAAALLGVKSTFQAKKAMDQCKRLGHKGIARAFDLLAQADLDLRGMKDWPEELVMEVLIARLSRLAVPARR